MRLYERIRLVLKELHSSQTQIATEMGINQRTFQGWLNAKREKNLWPLLPKILEVCPSISRQWLYFEEGPMFIGKDLKPGQAVPFEDLKEAVEAMKKDASGVHRSLLEYITAVETDDKSETVRTLEAELEEERKLTRQLTARVLLTTSVADGSGQSTGDAAASGR